MENSFYYNRRSIARLNDQASCALTSRHNCSLDLFQHRPGFFQTQNLSVMLGKTLAPVLAIDTIPACCPITGENKEDL